MRNEHVHAVIFEVEFDHLLREFETDWVCLCETQEAEWSIVDVVCDLLVEDLGLLGAESDVKAGLLTWRNDLAEWGALSKLWVLVDHDSHVNVLSQVIRDVERPSGGALDEDVLEVDLLRTSVNLR